MFLHLWLGGLTALLLGLTALSLWAAKKARDHRMATDRRLDGLGGELFAKADALNRRCDELRAAVDRLGALEARVKLLELEKELAGLEGDLRGRLEEAIAALRKDLAAEDVP